MKTKKVVKRLSYSQEGGSFFADFYQLAWGKWIRYARVCVDPATFPGGREFPIKSPMFANTISVRRVGDDLEIRA